MASTPQARTKSPTIKRIMREAAELSNAPSPDYAAGPLDTDLFEWHFTMRGPPNSAYSEGLYHGRIVLPPTYPLRPPSFRFTTPNGRFEANREICLSISGHHEETWQPAWGIRTAIVALRSFMETDAQGQLGGYDTTEAVRRRLAGDSPAYRCPTCGRTNAEIIKESEELAEQTSSAEQEIQIPDELNMGFRDEMEAAKNKKREAEEDAETAELAEGFVQTVPDPPAAMRPAAARVPLPAQVGQNQARPAQGVPQPTPTVQAPATVGQQQTVQAAARRTNNDGVPVWIDRLIVALVVLLAALLLKVLFGA